jgi:hypothetical protein
MRLSAHTNAPLLSRLEMLIVITPDNVTQLTALCTVGIQIAACCAKKLRKMSGAHHSMAHNEIFCCCQKMSTNFI